MESAIICPIDNPKPKIEKPKQTYKCQRCNAVLNSINYLQRHLTKCNGLKCPKCNVLFSSRHALNSHIENCGLFICLFCNKEFTSKFIYNKHLTKCKKKDISKEKINKKPIQKKTIVKSKEIIRSNKNEVKYQIIDSSDEETNELKQNNINILPNNLDYSNLYNKIGKELSSNIINYVIKDNNIFST